ncbi:MAG TPA: metallophosphoesterase [Drouetiella sp.]
MPTRFRLQSVAAVLAASISLATAAHAADSQVFFAKPYLQLGNHPKAAAKETEEIVWLSTAKKQWAVDVKEHDSKDWAQCKSDIKHHPLKDANVADLEIFSCELTGLTPGKQFDYRVRADKENVFSATATARKTADQPIKIAIFGDCGAGTKAQLKIAYQSYKYDPDMLIIPGDIIYNLGLFSEYAKRMFPVYNADVADEKTGVPLMRSRLTVPVLGNHDIACNLKKLGTNLDTYPDALAYFTVWSQPHNGPDTKYGGNNTPGIIGTEAHKDNFLKSAGDNYPNMANYSFDYGNTHWTVLDGNFYMDWTNPKLREWVKSDLANAKNATWKFVTFHQPGFSEDIEHNLEQRMRLLCDIFQEEGVDVVWAGHVHNYQRSFPLKFQVETKDGKPVVQPSGAVPGTFKFDKEYDGKTKTKPNGILYIVTGAGGQELYAERAVPKEGDFMCKFNGSVHSFTRCDINGGVMNVEQLDENGKIIDAFKVTKK